ncbi:MAG: hypothetical protein FJW38_23045 [Acidobacteria bacterium]|nr:hypothetical protein [Acidobacteriota bacterium]
MRFKAEPSRLQKLVRKGFRGYPQGTVAFYGPDDERATKTVVAVFLEPNKEPEFFERWFDNTGGMMFDRTVHAKVMAVFERYGVRSVAMESIILGCPHEEGLDYPDGESCPQCPFWAGRSRPLGL